MQNSIRNWNKLDTALYDHFMTVLDKKIEKYGRVKMAAEVEELKQKVEEWNKKCIEKYSQFDDKPWIARIKLKPKAGAECEKVMKNLLPLQHIYEIYLLLKVLK